MVYSIYPYNEHRVLFSEKVLLLNWLSLTTGCRYVITSLWKRIFSLREITRRLLDAGLASRNLIVGVTPDLGGYFPRRDIEIYTWLSETHDLNWIVLDDKEIDNIPQERFFQTDFWTTGFTQEIARKIAGYFDK